MLCIQEIYCLIVGNDDFDKETHTYDVSVIMGIISNHIDDAFLGK